MSLTQRTDHIEAGLARLVEQLKGKPKLTALLSIFLGQVQNIEDALWQLYTLRWLDTATGAQLDTLGRIVGEPRGNSVDDTEYRKRVRARVRTNLSSGTVNDLIAIFVGCFGLQVEIETQPPAGLSLRITEITTAADVAIYLPFLLEAKAAGVSVVLEWIESEPYETFTFAVSTSTTAFIGIGSGLMLPVQSTASFPNSGSLTLDYGVSAAQETVTYSSKDATNFYGVTTTHAHDQGATVTCDAASIGLGFGDSANPSVGGKLASAANGN